MADNNSTNNRRNVTGSYPGVTGSYRKPQQTPVTRSEAVKQDRKKTEHPKKEGFDFKQWFSKDNVRDFMRQLRYYGIIVAVSLLLTFGIVSAANDVFAFIKPDESIIVSVAQGDSVSAISKALADAGVIEHPILFRLYSKLKKADASYQYGDYTLNSNLNYDQIISKLKKISVQAQTVTVTVDSGWTQDEIANYFVSQKYVTAADMEYALNSYEYNSKEFDFISDLPERRCRLEGYLPAGEYVISVGESAVSIVSKMLTRFKETVLTEANLTLINASTMSLDEIITTASLVNAECDSESMYKGAAAVIMNRLASADNNFLNLTSPINYVLSSPKAVLNADDKRTASRYNTYLYSGLPTGPICNPSLNAISAVLAPETSAYMYFISDGENSYFSTTLEEHTKNLEKCSKGCKGTNTI